VIAIRNQSKAVLPEWASTIKAVRGKLRLSQRELAKKLQTSAMAISRWERGEFEPAADAYLRLGKLTGDPLCWFFWGRAGLTTADVMRVLPKTGRRRREASIPSVPVVHAGAGRTLPAEKESFVAIPLLPVRAATPGEEGDKVADVNQFKPGLAKRRSKERPERVEAELRQSNQELEHRVKERTAELGHKVVEIRKKAALLDLANDAIFVKTADGKISYWNRGAERLYGWTMSEALGHSPAELLHSEYPIPLEEIESRDGWEGEIRHTTRNRSRIVVASRWTKLRDNDGEPAGWLEINTDITPRKRAEAAARSLSGRILTLQDEERRKIARGLHDSLGQYLAALKMNLDLLATSDGNREKLTSECSAIVDRCLTETRTISHLLHPPLLDEAGFGSAARWYVDGFAQRSGIKVNIDLPPRLDRLPKDAEIALFRVVQEGLTNVHRHSGASAVDISVGVDAKRVHLEISDNGRGIPKNRLTHMTDGDGEVGVGIAGMRERVRELRGSLEIKSDRRGTKVIVAIPLLRWLQPSQHRTKNRGQRLLLHRTPFDGAGERWRDRNHNPRY
jgi:PAS domain S-box-containing protein